MGQKESWVAIVAPKKAHSTQRGQPPRMHGPGMWSYTLYIYTVYLHYI